MTYLIFEPDKKEYIVETRPNVESLPGGTYCYGINEHGVGVWYWIVAITPLFKIDIRIYTEARIPKEFLLKKLLLS